MHGNEVSSIAVLPTILSTVLVHDTIETLTETIKPALAYITSPHVLMIFMRHSSLCTRESTLYHLRLKYKINRLKVTFWFILAEWVTTKAQVRLLHVAELSGLSSSWLALQGVSAWEHGSTSCHNTPSLNMECCDTCRPP